MKARSFSGPPADLRGALLVVLVGVVMAITPLAAGAQDSRFTEFHTWTDLATIYDFSETFRYDGDYGLRGVATDEYWTLLYLRPSVRYRPKAWMTVHGGAALFYNFFQGEPDLPEIRPWAGIRFTWPRLKGFNFTHYFRLEYRAFYDKEQSEWDSWFRGRYQLQFRTRSFHIGKARGFFGLASIEPFEDIGTEDNQTLGDRLRVNFGFGKFVSDALRVELNYLYHLVRLSDEMGDFDFDDHVVRLRFFYTVN
jgi:hypothetical protein